MKPDKGEAASRERDGLQSTQSENVVEEENTTKGEWDLDYELDQVAEITSPLEQDRELQRLKKKSGESIDVLRREVKHRLKGKDPEDLASVRLVSVGTEILSPGEGRYRSQTGSKDFRV